MRYLRPFTLLLAALTLGCDGDVLGPVPLTGTYVLAYVGADAPPSLAASGMTGTIRVESATLEFQDNLVRLRRTERWVETDPEGKVLREWTVEMDQLTEWTLRGDRLIVGQPCNDPLANCPYAEGGEVHGGMLVMQPWYSDKPWIYQRGG